jgi:hypothetical protein
MNLTTPPSPGRAYTADEKARMIAEGQKQIAAASQPPVVQ